MPFSRIFDDTYHLAIKPACEAAEAYAERVDEQIFTGSILDRVYNQIDKADVIVADLSERNANVFYEVGYAHALGKTTVLLTRSAEDIPFDLKHFPHIVYGDRLLDLKSQLEATVRWHLSNPTQADESTVDIQLRVNGIPMGENAVVPYNLAARATRLHLKLELENRVSRVISTVECRLGLLYPFAFDTADTNDNYQNTEIEIDGSTRLCLASKPLTLLPGAWGTMTFTIVAQNRPLQSGDSYPLTLRLYRTSGVRDYSFVVEALEEKNNPS